MKFDEFKKKYGTSEKNKGQTNNSKQKKTKAKNNKPNKTNKMKSKKGKNNNNKNKGNNRSKSSYDSGLPTASSEEIKEKQKRLEESNRRKKEFMEKKRKQSEEELRLAKELFEKYPIAPKECVTRIGKPRCIVIGHTVEDIKMAVPVVTYEGAIQYRTFSGARCKTCGKLYMLESEYERLREIGAILCRIVQEDYWTEQHSNSFDLKDESILHMYGYNVNKEDNLSKAQRQTILSFFVDNNILTRAEIAHHLDFCVSLRARNPQFDEAIGKWNEDKKYILNYKPDSIDIVEIGTIRHRRPISH